jgi:hypothetical protein
MKATLRVRHQDFRRWLELGMALMLLLLLVDYIFSPQPALPRMRRA